MRGLRKERKSLCVRGHGHHGEVEDRAGVQSGEGHRRSILFFLYFFLSYKQNMLMLTSARKATTTSALEKICRTLQKKRQALMTLQRELRQKGHNAKLRFDKLITEDAMYTYDPFNDQIMRHNKCNKKLATNPDARPWHDERVQQRGRSWEGGSARNVPRGPALFHDRQHSHNTDLDKRRTLQTTCCNRPTSLLCVQCRIQASESQTRTPSTVITPA